MKLIDKDTLVAEINRRIKEEIASTTTDFNYYSQGCVDSMRKVLLFLDTLEVKEVDLEKEIDHYFQDNWPFEEEMCDMVKFAKHFYELGLAQKGE